MNEILLYLQESENFPSEKIYCIHINKKEDLMVIREHLKVAVIATFDYSCLSNQETDFVVELNKQQKLFCKGCVRHHCEKISAFFDSVIFNSN